MLALFSPAWPLQPCCSTRTDGHCRNWHEKAGPVNEDGRAGCRSTSKQANGPSSSPERCRASSDARPCCSRQAPTRSAACSVLYTIMTLQLASRCSCIKKTRQTGKGTGVFQPERVDILSHHLLVEPGKLSFSVPALVGPARRRVRVGGAVRLASPTRWCRCTVLRRGVRQQSMLPSTLRRGQGLSSFSSDEEYHHSSMN